MWVEQLDWWVGYLLLAYIIIEPYFAAYKTVRKRLSCTGLSLDVRGGPPTYYLLVGALS